MCHAMAGCAETEARLQLWVSGKVYRCIIYRKELSCLILLVTLPSVFHFHLFGNLGTDCCTTSDRARVLKHL